MGVEIDDPAIGSMGRARQRGPMFRRKREDDAPAPPLPKDRDWFPWRKPTVNG